MELGVLYAINIGGSTKPGVVLDPGVAPNKCRVKTWWTWPGQEDDYLNPEPPITAPEAKFDNKLANTNEVVELWSEYCERVKAERQALIKKRQAEEAEREAEQKNRIARVDAVLATLEQRGFSDKDSLSINLRWCARNTRWTSYEFSAKDVVELIEALTQAPADTEVSQ